MSVLCRPSPYTRHSSELNGSPEHTSP
jgi:hypothetical protein